MTKTLKMPTDGGYLHKAVFLLQGTFPCQGVIGVSARRKSELPQPRKWASSKRQLTTQPLLLRVPFSFPQASKAELKGSVLWNI